MKRDRFQYPDSSADNLQPFAHHRRFPVACQMCQCWCRCWFASYGSRDRHNVLATSGKAVEAGGGFIPVKGVTGTLLNKRHLAMQVVRQAKNMQVIVVVERRSHR